MSNQTHDRPDDEHTIPSRKLAYSDPLDKVEDRPVETPRMTDTGARALSAGAPWLLRQHFSNQIDLTKELNSRYPALQLLSVSRFRSLDTRHGVAALATADGVASLIVDADGASGMMDFAFSFASTHTLRFRLDHLTAVDRASWLDRMHRDKDDVAFLWGESRWNRDYVICTLHKKFVNVYAFSQNNFEAAARLSPEVAGKLVSWLETIWKADAEPEPPSQLLTW